MTLVLTPIDSNRLANKHFLKVADLAALEGDYYKAIEHYERIGRSSINNSLMKWSVKDYFLKAGVCHLATNVCPIYFTFSYIEHMLTYLIRTWWPPTVPLKATVKSTQPLLQRENTNSWLTWSKPLKKRIRKRLPISSSSMTSSVNSTSGRPLFYCGSRTISRKKGRISRRLLSL